MTKPLSLLKPATVDLATHVGLSLSIPTITPERRALLLRIYSMMNPDAKAIAQLGMRS